MQQKIPLPYGRNRKSVVGDADSSRQVILQSSGRLFLLWGSLLSVMSLLIFFLWKGTGHPYWNFLWFAMPLTGSVMSALSPNRGEAAPVTFLRRIIGGVWIAFGVFSVALSLLALLINFFSPDLPHLLLAANTTSSIILLFGLSETVTGVILKYWPIMISGFLVGIGGMVLYFWEGVAPEQLLVLTLCGVILAGTGIVIARRPDAE